MNPIDLDEGEDGDLHGDALVTSHFLPSEFPEADEWPVPILPPPAPQLQPQQVTVPPQEARTQPLPAVQSSPPSSSAPPRLTQGGRDPKRTRANESRYRGELSTLFAELAQLTGGSTTTKINKRTVLEGAIRRLRHAQQRQQQQQQVVSPLPIDHRHLFLADCTPQAILGLDGRFLDANRALLNTYGLSLQELLEQTLFTKTQVRVLFFPQFF